MFQWKTSLEVLLFDAGVGNIAVTKGFLGFFCVRVSFLPERNGITLVTDL
jgi:hypothetical protein